MITIEVVSEYLGMDADKEMWKYGHRHWLALFPNLGSRSSFVRQAANLWEYKSLIQQRLAQQLLGAFVDHVHLIDGIPIALCGFSRAPRCRLFTTEASYGYCAAKKLTYYGFHGHLLMSATGIITGFTLTPANGSEREALWEVVSNVQGVVIGDKGYLSQFLGEQLQAHNLSLQTPLRANMHDERQRSQVKLLQRVRRLIETVMGQLVDRFHIEKVRARDLWHLTSRLNRKLLAHTLCRWLNRHHLILFSLTT
ncbi:MAG: IS982 family transposase [Leptolyngbyaceae cyanobacterium SU_3_3]|nr:IS982 family transposase [Leptolyngbyaceae cyanobacterium SU_3_3]